MMISSKAMEPLIKESRPDKVLIRVVLPAPEGPITAIIPVSGISMVVLSITWSGLELKR